MRQIKHSYFFYGTIFWHNNNQYCAEYIVNHKYLNNTVGSGFFRIRKPVPQISQHAISGGTYFRKIIDRGLAMKTQDNKFGFTKFIAGLRKAAGAEMYYSHDEEFGGQAGGSASEACHHNGHRHAESGKVNH